MGDDRTGAKVINRFRGEYGFLSAFYEAEIWYGGLRCATNAHAFQSAKAEDLPRRIMIAEAPSARRAKQLGGMIKLRWDWEKVKRIVMLEVNVLKFTLHPELRRRLLETGEDQLIEGNTWGDTYWGVDLHRGEGENWLGKTLMYVRKLMKE